MASRARSIRRFESSTSRLTRRILLQAAPVSSTTMTSPHAPIVPITLTVNARTGLTLYALPWEDEDGDECQGFLGDGPKILLFPTTAELAAFIPSGEENDLSDHPGYEQVLKAPPD